MGSVAFAAKGGKGEKGGKGKKPGKGEKQEPEGLCLEPEMIMKMCVMGTPFGTKMMEAKMKCMAPMESRKGKGKGKGKKPSKCPSVDDIVEEVAKEMSDEICIFQELGWMDAEYNEDEAMYMADIASLPSNVSAALDSDDDFEECYMMVEAAMDAKMNCLLQEELYEGLHWRSQEQDGCKNGRNDGTGHNYGWLNNHIFSLIIIRI